MEKHSTAKYADADLEFRKRIVDRLVIIELAKSAKRHKARIHGLTDSFPQFRVGEVGRG